MSVGRVRMGCPMWANRDWVGRHLPESVPAGTELSAYARLLDAVEGNTTFYALPDADTVRRWASQAPADFRFVCKLPRHITHERRLRDVDAEVAEACARLAPLGERLGPLTAQLPPTFGPDDLPVLVEFLRRVPDEFDWAVEPRHPAFAARGTHEAEFDAVLRDHGVDRVIIDTRALFAGPQATAAEIEGFRRKPRLGVRPVATGDTPIVRFVGQTDVAANEPFWRRWLEPLARWVGEGRRPIFFAHTPDNLDAPLLARTVHAALRDTIDGLAPLPDPPPVRRQPGLF